MKKTHLLLLVVVFFVFLHVPLAGAVIEQDEMNIYAVTSSNEALKAELIINIRPGSGKIWSSVGPLVGTSTQHTEKVSVELAKNYFDRVDQYDYLFDINSEAAVVEGPSAGAAMSLLLISMLQDKELPDYVSITGHISENGSIGSVGGIFEKAKKASETGIKLFLIPEGEAFQMHRFPDGVKTVNLTDYAFREWGMKVVEASNIGEALELAFTDIDQIDVNTEPKKEPEMFVPKEIEITPTIKPMKEITSKYIKKANQALDSARDALNESNIDEPILVEALLDSLRNSNRTLEKAKLLQEKNYLYSSANYAFITIVESNLVRDLSENPSLIEPDSTLLEMKATELYEEIKDFEEDLNEFYSLEYMEWIIAAKQRLSWAKLKAQQLTKTRTIVISSTGKTVSDISIAIENLRDYQFAREWLSVSRDFLQVAENAQEKIEPVNILEEKANRYIVEAENQLALIQGNDIEDIKRRLNAAKLATKMGWNDSALFDAASALAFGRAESEIKGKSLKELLNSLNQKLSRLKSELSSTETELVWPKLYFDHAHYFFDSAKYFEEQQNISRALEDAKSGLRLAFFAEEMLSATKQARAELRSLPLTKPYKPGIKKTVIEPLMEENALFPVLALIGVIIGITVVLVSRTFFHPIKKADEAFISKKIDRLEKLRHHAHRARLKRKLSEEEYKEKAADYEKQLKKLEKEREKRSKHLIEMDRLHGELEKVRYMLSELKEQYKEGEIVESDYREVLDSLTKRLSDLRYQISKEEKQSKKPKKPKKTKKTKPKKGKKNSKKPKK